MSSPQKTIPARAAFAQARSNAQRRYPHPDRDGDRLYPVASPMPRPSFAMSPDDTVFAIGSCFARSIETALIGAGMQVPSREENLGLIGDNLGFAPNMFNKYTVPSMLNDLTWALERDTHPGQALLYPLPDQDAYVDLQLGMAKLPFSVAEIMAFREKYLNVMARVVDADVVVVTLGYVETWVDTQLGITLNMAPPAPLVKADPDRFAFQVLSYADVLQGLHDLHTLLCKHRSKPLRMLVTVSPVPLLNTFRDMDVLVANTYSKSVQRAAVDAFVTATDGADYFPSYETVMLSDPKAAWMDKDFRHVTPALVTHIMQNVLTAYTGAAPPMTAASLQSQLQLLDSTGDHTSVLALAADHPALWADHSVMLEIVGDAHVATGNALIAQDMFAHAFALTPEKGGPMQRLMQAYDLNGRHDLLAPLLAEHTNRYPKRAKFRATLTLK